MPAGMPPRRSAGSLRASVAKQGGLTALMPSPHGRRVGAQRPRPGACVKGSVFNRDLIPAEQRRGGAGSVTTSLLLPAMGLLQNEMDVIGVRLRRVLPVSHSLYARVC